MDRRSIKNVYYSQLQQQVKRAKKITDFAFLMVSQNMIFCTLVAINPSKMGQNQTSGGVSRKIKREEAAAMEDY